VDCYLPYFRQQLITHPLLSLLPFQTLFTESFHGDQLLTPPPFSSVLTAPHPICCMFLFTFLFIVQFFWFFFFFAVWGVNLSRGLCWFISGVPVGKPRDAWCSPVGLPNVSQACFSWCLEAWEPSCFLSVMWCGEALYGLGVQGVEVLILLGALFLPSAAPVSQQDFRFTELKLSASAP
jgi:hypothetical protein